MVNGKRYVGQTWTSLRHRWRGHQRNSRCRKLHRAIKAHGADAFTIELLTFAATQEMADHLEAYFMERHQTRERGYNIREGGAKGKLSIETRAKMSAAHRGKIISPAQREKARLANLGKKRGPRPAEWRAKNGAAQRGKVVSLETRARMSAAGLGRKHSAETRAKMSATRKGRPIPQDTREKIRHTLSTVSEEVRQERIQTRLATRRAKHGPTGRRKVGS
jgi:group I intron endonuclease